MKRCGVCKVLKSLEQFSRDRRNKRDGRQYRCKDCHRIYLSRWQKENREKLNASKRRYQERNPEYLRKAIETVKQRYPEKYRARYTVHNAVKQGRLKKPEHCESCGQFAEKQHIHAHHHDYSKPLDIEWLCRTCHHELHKTELVGANA